MPREERAKPAQDAVRRALVVVGMHRSGTSPTTRVLSLLGADLPRRLMPPDAGNNDLGFWEPLNLVELNDEVLASAGSRWDDIQSFPEAWFGGPEAEKWAQRAVVELDKDFGDSTLFLLKDPRVCRLLPFWQEVLRHFGAEPSFVLPFRNPIEVAASLEARDGLHPSWSLLLWLRHVLAAERDTRSFPRSFVPYADLIQDWRGTVDRVARQLDLQWPRSTDEAEDEIDRFLSDRYYRRRSAPGVLEARADIVDWVKSAYSALVAQGVDDPHAIDGTFDDIRSQLANADRAFDPILQELRRQKRDLAITAEAREREIEALRSGGSEQTERLGALLGEVHQLRAAASATASEMRRIREWVSTRAREVDQLTGRLADRQHKIGKLQASLEAAKARLAATEEALEIARAEQARLLHEWELLTDESTAGKQALEDLQEDLSTARENQEKLRRELQGRSSELGAVRGVLNARLDELAQIKRSRSWRLTSYLRRAMLALRGGRGTAPRRSK